MSLPLSKHYLSERSPFAWYTSTFSAQTAADVEAIATIANNVTTATIEMGDQKYVLFDGTETNIDGATGHLITAIAQNAAPSGATAPTEKSSGIALNGFKSYLAHGDPITSYSEDTVGEAGNYAAAHFVVKMKYNSAANTNLSYDLKFSIPAAENQYVVAVKTSGQSTYETKALTISGSNATCTLYASIKQPTDADVNYDVLIWVKGSHVDGSTVALPAGGTIVFTLDAA